MNLLFSCIIESQINFVEVINIPKIISIRWRNVSLLGNFIVKVNQADGDFMR